MARPLGYDADASHECHHIHDQWPSIQCTVPSTQYPIPCNIQHPVTSAKSKGLSAIDATAAVSADRRSQITDHDGLSAHANEC